MTLAEATQNIGRRVTVVDSPMGTVTGTIKSVSYSLVFVNYDGAKYDHGTEPEKITLIQ